MADQEPWLSDHDARFVSKEYHRHFVQMVQREAMQMRLETKIEQVWRWNQDIVSERRRPSKAAFDLWLTGHAPFYPARAVNNDPTGFDAVFQVYWDDWQVLAREHDAMTPDTCFEVNHRRWDALKLSFVQALAQG